MPTATNSANLSNSSATSEQTMSTRKIEFLNSLESQMKSIWCQYVDRIDKNGFDEEAVKLRGQYFNLYRCYKMNRKWMEAISKRI